MGLDSSSIVRTYIEGGGGGYNPGGGTHIYVQYRYVPR